MQDKKESEEENNNNNNNNNSNNNNNKGTLPRLPRWTRQEILVLIQGKRVAELRLSRGSGRVLGPLEPKWATVSSYCKAHGVDRGPVQCRKRWSNLSGDYKKIKDWESGCLGQKESFWVMRNDLRRDCRLPGFFDKEVYDILDKAPPTTTTTTSSGAVGLVLALGPTTHDGDDVAATTEKEESAAAQEPAPKIPSPLPISEQQCSSPKKGLSSKGTNVGKEDGFFNPEVGDTSGGEGRKRKRSSSADRNDDEETNVLQHQLISVLEKNGQMLNTHLQSQNTNSQMDREQRKDHVDSLVAVLGKLADALGRIADKL